MIWILFSILCSTWLVLSFKVFEKFSLDTLQVIIFNYIACVLTAWVTEGHFPIPSHVWEFDWFPVCFLLAFCFILGFNGVALTVRKVSVTVASILQKMSLLWTVAFAYWMYHEPMSGFRIIGIVLAIIAIILTNLKPKGTTTGHLSQYLFLLSITFVLSGLVDVGIFYLGKSLSHDGANTETIATIFGIAGILGLMYLAYAIIVKKIIFDPRCILGGILLGVPNYGSIYFIVKGLSQGMDGSVVFPIANMSIILLSSMLAVLIFTERLTKINVAGVALAILSIAIIAFA